MYLGIRFCRVKEHIGVIFGAFSAWAWSIGEGGGFVALRLWEVWDRVSPQQ
jgi:hypothetical protein